MKAYISHRGSFYLSSVGLAQMSLHPYINPRQGFPRGKQQCLNKTAMVLVEQINRLLFATLLLLLRSVKNRLQYCTIDTND